jgi:isopentenyldiphosphate isomerase
MRDPLRTIQNPLWRFFYRLGHPREEWFGIYDDTGHGIGEAPRSLCHNGTFLLHKTAHLIVVNDSGEILLQKRHPSKDIQPEKWDTSVGGHLLPAESPEGGVLREAKEELGLELRPEDISELYDYRMRSDREAEWVHTFLHETEKDEFRFDPFEITEVRFWADEEIRRCLGSGVFTPNFIDEFRRFSGWKDHDGRKVV